MALPAQQGLYDPRHQHDACGVGFVVNLKGRKSHEVIACGLEILVNLNHRGAVGADPLVGDGAGVLIQLPDALYRDWATKAGLELPEPGHYGVAMCFMPQEEAARELAVGQFEGAQGLNTRVQQLVVGPGFARGGEHLVVRQAQRIVVRPPHGRRSFCRRSDLDHAPA